MFTIMSMADRKIDYWAEERLESHVEPSRHVL